MTIKRTAITLAQEDEICLTFGAGDADAAWYLFRFLAHALSDRVSGADRRRYMKCALRSLEEIVREGFEDLPDEQTNDTLNAGRKQQKG